MRVPSVPQRRSNGLVLENVYSDSSDRLPGVAKARNLGTGAWVPYGRSPLFFVDSHQPPLPPRHARTPLTRHPPPTSLRKKQQAAKDHSPAWARRDAGRNNQDCCVQEFLWNGALLQSSRPQRSKDLLRGTSSSSSAEHRVERT